MFFKNLIIYRLPVNYQLTADDLDATLAPFGFVSASSNEMERQGWVSPRENDKLVHAVNKQLLIKLCTEKKKIPSSYVKECVKAKAAEMEEMQGFAPGRKQLKELKEQVTDELMARAFPIKSFVTAWMDPVNGYLVVDGSSASKADLIFRFLLKGVDKFPASTIMTVHSPANAMTAWLATDEAPVGFTVDQDTELCASESKAKVRYAKHTLDTDDVRTHIAAGKQCTRLAMTWNDKISFVLADNFIIKNVKPLDVIKENDSVGTKNDEERFDSDMVLMTGELSKMIGDIIAALGGEQPKN